MALKTVPKVPFPTTSIGLYSSSGLSSYFFVWLRDIDDGYWCNRLCATRSFVPTVKLANFLFISESWLLCLRGDSSNSSGSVTIFFLAYRWTALSGPTVFPVDSSLFLIALTLDVLGGKRLRVANIVPLDRGFFSGALRPSGMLIMYFFSLFLLNISSMLYLLKLPEAFPSEGSYISVAMRRPASLTLLRPNDDNSYL